MKQYFTIVAATICLFFSSLTSADSASGVPSDKRQHNPGTITKPADKNEGRPDKPVSKAIVRNPDKQPEKKPGQIYFPHPVRYPPGQKSD